MSETFIVGNFQNCSIMFGVLALWVRISGFHQVTEGLSSTLYLKTLNDGSINGKPEMFVSAILDGKNEKIKGSDSGG